METVGDSDKVEVRGKKWGDHGECHCREQSHQGVREEMGEGLRTTGGILKTEYLS